jgi:hypothetical protein
MKEKILHLQSQTNYNVLLNLRADGYRSDWRHIHFVSGAVRLHLVSTTRLNSDLSRSWPAKISCTRVRDRLSDTYLQSSRCLLQTDLIFCHRFTVPKQINKVNSWIIWIYTHIQTQVMILHRDVCAWVCAMQDYGQS